MKGSKNGFLPADLRPPHPQSKVEKELQARRKELQGRLLVQAPLARSLREAGKAKRVKKRHRQHRKEVKGLLKEMRRTF
jgi:hypothetical protein